MRILHVNKFLYRRGGSEGYMLDVAELQRKAGHEVELWGMQHPDNDSPLPLADTFAPYLELEPPPRGWAAVTAGGRMVWSTASQRGMAEAIHRFRPDLVHCHNIFHHLSPSILRPIGKAKIPCVMTLHDYKLACPSYQMLDHGEMCHRCVTGGTWHAAKQRCKDGSLAASSLLAIESGLHRATNAYGDVGLFISPSRFLSEIMAQSGVRPDRLRVVRHFIDLAGIPRSDGSGRRLLFAGRLASEKGVDTLIEAVGLLPEHVHLDIAGDGPMRDSLERLAADRVPGRVVFHGRLDLPELRALFAGALASVVPSRWYENQPMTILESFAAAVPVVGSNLGGTPELIRNEVEGLVVPHNDPPALAAALARLVEDPRWAHRLGCNALDRLREDFTPEAHLAALADAYHHAGAAGQSRRQGLSAVR